MLPGPPRELRPMFTDSVVPLLRRVLPLASGFVCRTLRTTGIGESVVQEKIGGPLQRWVEAGLDLGYCARPGQVDVRLAARGGDAEQQVREAEAIVRELLGPHIYGVEDEDLETVIVRLLTERKATLALAESCTGGCIANRVTNVPGASAVLLAGLVTYSNAAKQKFLGVQRGHSGPARRGERSRGARNGRRRAPANPGGLRAVGYGHRRPQRRHAREAGRDRVHRPGRPVRHRG